MFLFSYLTAKESAQEKSVGSGGSDDSGISQQQKVNFVDIFPWFVLGFLALALIRTTGVLPEMLISGISFVSDFLIIMALAGIGAGIRFESLRGLGIKAFATGLSASIIMGATSLILVMLFIG